MTVQPTRDQLRALADIDREWIRELADKAHVEGFFLYDSEVPELLTDVTKLLDQLAAAEARIAAWEAQYAQDIADANRATDEAEARIKAVEDMCDDADKRHASVAIVTKIRRALEG